MPSETEPAELFRPMRVIIPGRKRLFDEFGQEVGPDELDFSLIDPNLPRWESYQADFERGRSLNMERGQLFELQEKLEAERLKAMPPSAAKHRPGCERPAPMPNIKAGFTASAAPASGQIIPGVKTVFQPEAM